jgi:uncharacterized membrane-anchored protein
MSENTQNDLSKVPAVTLTFWVVKILATTLGETGGDAVSMSMNLGYVIASIIFLGIFASLVAAQIAAKSFHPFLYWACYYCNNNTGHDIGGFRGPFARHRLRRRIITPLHPSDGVAPYLV